MAGGQPADPMRPSDERPLPRPVRALAGWLTAVAFVVGAGAVGFAAVEPVDATTPFEVTDPAFDTGEVEGYQRRTTIDRTVAAAVAVIPAEQPDLPSPASTVAHPVGNRAGTPVLRPGGPDRSRAPPLPVG